MASLERGATPGTTMRLLGATIPVLTGFLCAFCTNIPVSLLGSSVPAPLLALVPLYFWCLVRPDLMTAAAAFAIGLVEDVMSGAPPGVWTLSFVLAWALVARQRDSFAGLSGLMAVLGFAVVAAATCLTAWAIVALLYWHLPPLAPILTQLAMTVLFYGPAALVISRLHHRFVGPLRSEI